MKLRTKGRLFEWNAGEYLSIGYDTDNLFIYLIKGNEENLPIRKLRDTKMAHDLSKSIYLAKKNDLPAFDIDKWVEEYIKN